MVEDTVTAGEIRTAKAADRGLLLVLIEDVERLNGAACHDGCMVATESKKRWSSTHQMVKCCSLSQSEL